MNVLALLAQAPDTISVSVGVAIAAVSALLGGAVAWGAISATVTALKEAVSRLTADVVSLSAIVADLKTEVAVLRATERIRHNTGSHAIHPTKRTNPDEE